jgi:hypothetical protein
MIFILVILMTHLSLVSAQAQSEPLMVNFITKYISSSCGSGVWFGWQDQQTNKPRLEIKYSLGGSSYTKNYQHGLNGMENAYGFFFKSSGWDGGGREFHKHNLNQKDGPVRHALFKCDISDVPKEAVITSAVLHLHIHSQEGLGSSACGTIGIFECTKDWNWDYVDWNNYDQGKSWNVPGGDYGTPIRTLRIREDMKALGYSKSNTRFPLDLTDYVKQLQEARSTQVNNTVLHGTNLKPVMDAFPNPFTGSINICFSGNDKAAHLGIYDVGGRMVEDLTSLIKGNIIEWRFTSKTPGIYAIRLRTSNKDIQKKIIYLP